MASAESSETGLLGQLQQPSQRSLMKTQLVSANCTADWKPTQLRDETAPLQAALAATKGNAGEDSGAGLAGGEGRAAGFNSRGG